MDLKATTEDTKDTKEINIKNETCNELKTIKYKSMMHNGTAWNEPKSATNLSNLDKFLENEKISNSNEPWSKLDKTAKTRKLLIFAEKYRTEQNLTDAEYSKLVAFFKDCLDKKKLQRVKDVIYDKITGLVKEIPALSYTKSTKHFTLKNIDKRLSTIKSLPPISKKTNGTLKNKNLLPIKTNDPEQNDSSSDHEN